MSDPMPPPKPSYDPGWNDPPTFNYSNAPPPTKPKLNLNKRIAFPIQSSSKSAPLPKVEKSGAGLPLPFAKVKQNVIPSNTAQPKGESSLLLSNENDEGMTNTALQLPPSMTTELKSSENNRELVDLSTIPQADDQRNLHEFVMETLRGINKSLETTDSSKVEEIDKRLNTLETMWIDGKIEERLKVLLGKTAEALKENQFHAAVELQRSIIIDHGSNVCSQWGPAIRQLILLKENESNPSLEECAPDTSTANEPTFINPLDDGNIGSSKGVGRVVHI